MPTHTGGVMILRPTVRDAMPRNSSGGYMPILPVQRDLQNLAAGVRWRIPIWIAQSRLPEAASGRTHAGAG
jgi:hypothetical protein